MTSYQTSARAQLGGTLLGLVVGILIGMVAALAVAVYVSNVPVPFVDRGVTRKPAQDAAEAEHNKGWNPNAGLVGTPAPLPEPVTTGETGAGPSLLEPGNAEDKPAGAAESGDPLGDLMRSKLDTATPAAPEPPSNVSAAPTPPAESAPAPAQPFIFFVQAGAFSSSDDANAQRAKVALMGMASQVSEREQAGRTVYRVRLGPFNQRSMAEATRDQLQKGGIDAALVRVER